MKSDNYNRKKFLATVSSVAAGGILLDGRILSPGAGSFASPMLTLLLADRFERTAFVRMLLDKYKISIRSTHKEFGFNGIRFSAHIFNTEKEIDFASEVMGRELG